MAAGYTEAEARALATATRPELAPLDLTEQERVLLEAAGGRQAPPETPPTMGELQLSATRIAEARARAEGAEEPLTKAERDRIAREESLRARVHPYEEGAELEELEEAVYGKPPVYARGYRRPQPPTETPEERFRRMQEAEIPLGQVLERAAVPVEAIEETKLDNVILEALGSFYDLAAGMSPTTTVDYLKADDAEKEAILEEARGRVDAAVEGAKTIFQLSPAYLAKQALDYATGDEQERIETLSEDLEAAGAAAELWGAAWDATRFAGKAVPAAARGAEELVSDKALATVRMLDGVIGGGKLAGVEGALERRREAAEVSLSRSLAVYQSRFDDIMAGLPPEATDEETLQALSRLAWDDLPRRLQRGDAPPAELLDQVPSSVVGSSPSLLRALESYQAGDREEAQRILSSDVPLRDLPAELAVERLDIAVARKVAEDRRAAKEKAGKPGVETLANALGSAMIDELTRRESIPGYLMRVAGGAAQEVFSEAAIPAKVHPAWAIGAAWLTELALLSGHGPDWTESLSENAKLVGKAWYDTWSGFYLPALVVPTLDAAEIAAGAATGGAIAGSPGAAVGAVIGAVDVIPSVAGIEYTLQDESPGAMFLKEALGIRGIDPLRSPDSTWWQRVMLKLHPDAPWAGLGMDAYYLLKAVDADWAGQDGWVTSVAATMGFVGDLTVPYEEALVRVPATAYLRGRAGVEAARIQKGEGASLAERAHLLVAGAVPEVYGGDALTAWQGAVEQVAGSMRRRGHSTFDELDGRVMDLVVEAARDLGIRPSELIGAERKAAETFAKRRLEAAGKILSYRDPVRDSPAYNRVREELEAIPDVFEPGQVDLAMAMLEVMGNLAVDNALARGGKTPTHLLSLDDWFSALTFREVPEAQLWGETGALRQGGEALPEGDVKQTAAPALTSDDVVQRLTRTGLVPNQTIVTILAGYPRYLDGVVDFLVTQRAKLIDGGMTPRDVAKAYFMTVSSQGTGAQRASIVEESVGFRVGDEFTTTGRLGRMVRPEEAAAAWLFTEDGQRALDAIDRGEFDETAWNTGADVRKSFGDDRVRNMNVFGKPTGKSFNMRNIADLTRQINAARGDTDKIDALVRRMNGIGSGKAGFIKHLLGIGESPTIDAVEINVWITGEGDIARMKGKRAELARLVKEFSDRGPVAAKIKELIENRFKQLRRLGIGEDIPSPVYNHVLHHWLWDRAKGLETTHAGMYWSQRFAQLAGQELRGTFRPMAPADLRAVVSFTEHGRFDTFLHEVGGHLLETLLGDDLYRRATEVFESEGGVLTRKGQEQLARSAERYLADRLAPDGRTRRLLDGLVLRMRYWWGELSRSLGLHKALPPAMAGAFAPKLARESDPWAGESVVDPGVKALLDQWWHPGAWLDDQIDRLAIGTMEAPADIPTIKVPTEAKEAVAEERVRRRRQRRAAAKEVADRDVLLQELSLRPGDQVPVTDLVDRLAGWASVQALRPRLLDRQIVRLSTRTVVPQDRQQQVLRASSGFFEHVAGWRPEDLRDTYSEADGRFHLDAAQQAGLAALVNRVAAEPMGHMVPERLLDVGANLSTITPVELAKVQEAVIDIHAGVGGHVSRRAADVPRSLAHAAFKALSDLAAKTAAEPGFSISAHWRDTLNRWFKTAKVAEGYVSPEVVDRVTALLRDLDPGAWIEREAARFKRAARTGSPGDLWAPFLRELVGQLTPPVRIDLLPDLADLLEDFGAAREPADIKTLASPARIRMIESLFAQPTTPRWFDHRPDPTTTDERIALRVLYRQALGQSVTDRALASALEVVRNGLHRRAELVRDRATQIAVALAGSDDLNVIERLSFEQLGQFYRLFYAGRLTELVRTATDMGLTVGLDPSVFQRAQGYDPSKAIVEMIARMRSMEIASRLASELAAVGVRASVGTAVTDIPFELLDRSAFFQDVEHYIKQELSFRLHWAEDDGVFRWRPGAPPSARVPAPEPVAGQPPPRRAGSAFRDVGAAYEFGWIARINDEVHNLAALTQAHRILTEWGFKLGKGADWKFRTLPDGSQAWIPEMIWEPIQQAIDRASRTGTAFGISRPGEALPRITGERVAAPTPELEVPRTTGQRAVATIGQVVEALLELNPFSPRRIRMGLTTWAPAYYVTNGLGALLQAYQRSGLAGALNAAFGEPLMTAAVVKRLWGPGYVKPEARLVVANGIAYDADSLAQVYRQHGAVQSFVTATTQRSLAASLRSAFGNRWQRVVGRFGDLQKLLGEFTQAIDNWMRVGLFIHELKRGRGPDEAARTAREAGFDYADMTEAERTILGNVFLFYSYTRRNLDLFFDTLLARPHLVLGQLRLLKGLNQFLLDDRETESLLGPYYDWRMALYVRRSVIDAHRRNRVAWLAPMMPLSDALGLLTLSDPGYGTTSEMEEAAGAIWGRTSPLISMFPVLATGRDERGFSLDRWQTIDPGFVELDEMLFDGWFVNGLLDASIEYEQDPSRWYGPTEPFVYKTRDGETWFVLRNVLHSLPLMGGRGISTTTQALRAVPGGLAEPRPWAARGEEAMGLLGFRAVPVYSEAGAAAARMEEQQRAMLERERHMAEIAP